MALHYHYCICTTTPSAFVLLPMALPLPRVLAFAGQLWLAAHGVKVTGATLFVVDAGVDTGPIVAQVAERHSGHVTAERAPSGGALFDLQLPGRPADRTEDSTEADLGTLPS